MFADHVCFYSNVFGYVKIKTIALRDVTIVNRAYTVQVFPNAVEIVHKGKCEFFTSFHLPGYGVQKNRRRVETREPVLAKSSPRTTRIKSERRAPTPERSNPISARADRRPRWRRCSA